MTATDKAGISLIIPSDFDLLTRVDEVEKCIAECAGFHLACLRLMSHDQKRETLIPRADHLRELGHRHDISVIIDDQFTLARELGLDGVHLTSSDPKLLREARKALGDEAIIGVFSGISKHDGMIMGEIGVDYISFGPVDNGGLDQQNADVDLFAWWSEMIEIPVIAEGGINNDNLSTIKDFIDFVALGREIFDAPNPTIQLRSLLNAL